MLFPWLHRQSRRLRAQGEWLPPRDDINSPDLYIPGTFNYQFFTDRYVLSSIMYSDGNCHLYSLDCLTLRDSCPFSSSGPIFFLFIISLSQLLINIFFSPSDSRRICLPCNSCCPPGLLLYKIGLLYTQYSRLLPGR